MKTNTFKHYNNSNCHLKMTKTEITRTVMAASERSRLSKTNSVQT